MKIDEEKCIECGMCIPYCTLGAIVADDGVVIDHDNCVECSVCLKAGVCPTDALVYETHPWPRSLREVFSNPAVEHKETRVAGRGTEEMKTNDVTGIYKRGFVGITAELGRPNLGTRFRDVEKVAQALAKAGASFAPKNPVTHLIVNKDTGDMIPEILDEKVLTAMVECLVPVELIPRMLAGLKEAAAQIDTIFSLDITGVLDPDGSVPYKDILDTQGFTYAPNGKLNLGLGKPLAEEISK